MRPPSTYRTVFGSLIASLALTMASPAVAHPLLLLKAKKEATLKHPAPVSPVPPLVAKSVVTKPKQAPAPAPMFVRRPGPPLPPPLTLKAMN